MLFCSRAVLRFHKNLSPCGPTSVFLYFVTSLPLYFNLAPISTSSSGNPANTGRPSGPTDAATIIPFDSTPRNFRGAKFTTTATFRPINFSGS
jgi:hypothetical protein